jgi:hypothetical protein
MKLQIKYSRTKLVEIEIDPSASLMELMQQVYKYDENAHKDLINLHVYTTSTLLLFQNQWLEEDKHLSDYDIQPGQVIDLISLRFSAEAVGPEQHHIPDEFVCQLTGEVFYQPMLLPSGVSVEKQYIDKWLSEHTKCPFTGSPLNFSELIENHPLKEKLTRLTQKYTILSSIVAKSQYQNQSLPSQPRISWPIEPDASDRFAIAQAIHGNSPETIIFDLNGNLTSSMRPIEWPYIHDRLPAQYITNPSRERAVDLHTLFGLRSLVNDSLWTSSIRPLTGVEIRRYLGNYTQRRSDIGLWSLLRDRSSLQYQTPTDALAISSATTNMMLAMHQAISLAYCANIICITLLLRQFARHYHIDNQTSANARLLTNQATNDQQLTLVRSQSMRMPTDELINELVRLMIVAGTTLTYTTSNQRRVNERNFLASSFSGIIDSIYLELNPDNLDENTVNATAFYLMFMNHMVMCAAMSGLLATHMSTPTAPATLFSSTLPTFFPSASPSRQVRSHSQQCIQETIVALQNYGVTANLIYQHWQPVVSRTAWLDAEKWALIYLVTGNCAEDDHENLPLLPPELCLTPPQALREMNRLHGYALSALKHLHRYGLTGAHLRQWRNDQGRNLFEREHFNALTYLVEQLEMHPTEAIRRIDGLSTGSARRIEQTALNLSI